jgi:cellobiose-specific phosphotransferase system component IIA
VFSQEIQNQDFSPRKTEAEAELNKANALLLKMNEFSVPVHNQSKAFEALRAKIQNFDDKLIDLSDHTDNAVHKANDAETLNDANNNSKVVSTVEKVKNLTQEANSTLEDAVKLLKNASALLRNAHDAFENLLVETQNGQDSRDRLNETLVTNQLELYEVRQPVQKAEEHALKLEMKVGIMIVMCLLKVHNLLLLPIALRPFQFGLGFHMVSEQFNFNRMELSSPCPTPSRPGGPMFSVGVVSLS